MGTEKQRLTVELLKLPILVFSILLSVVALKHFLGLEFGTVTEVGTQGVRFSEQSQATLQALADLETKVNESVVRIEALEQRTPRSQDEAKKIDSEAFSASQSVSETTTELAKLQRERQKDQEGRASKAEGYIWIGNYNDTWEHPRLASIETGQPIMLEPRQIEAGTEYRLLGNMVLRDGLPPNDVDYFRSRESLGVVPRGTRITLRRVPVAIDREFAVQYWAEIEVSRGNS